MSRKFSHFMPLNGILKCIAFSALVLMIVNKDKYFTFIVESWIFAFHIILIMI